MKLNRLVIFAKAPRAGLAKSRLIPALGADGAARLAQRMLEHALAQSLEANIGSVELCCTPAQDPLWQQIAISQTVLCTDQGEGDLGERMARAAERIITGGEAIILIGTDCPQLAASSLQQLAEALVDHDAVMIPTVDGGYVALGLNRFDLVLFSNIDWGTDTVAHKTLGHLQDLGWSIKLLPMMRDIDEPDDLAWLPAEMKP